MALFVSKNVAYAPLLDLLRTKDIPLMDQSLIAFESVNFTCPNPADYSVIFFSSPRAVEYYLNHCTIPAKTQIASIGKATSEALKTRNCTIDFEGKNSGQPGEVARAFTAFAAGQSVLFPQSDRSNRSMQQRLAPEQVIDLVVYKTVLQPAIIHPTPSVLVFTSPSNAEAFLQSNTIYEYQKVIAWGQTTAAFLKEESIDVHHALRHSTFQELTAYVEGLIRSGVMGG